MPQLSLIALLTPLANILLTSLTPVRAKESFTTLPARLKPTSLLAPTASLIPTARPASIVPSKPTHGMYSGAVWGNILTALVLMGVVALLLLAMVVLGLGADVGLGRWRIKRKKVVRFEE